MPAENLNTGKILREHFERTGIFLSSTGFFHHAVKRVLMQQTNNKKMANQRAFISFDFDNDKDYKELFAGQSKNSRTPFNIEDWASKEHLPQREWERLIQEKINKCNMLIVLVGKRTYLAAGVEKEIAFAKDNNVPIFGVYVNGADSSTSLPDGLSRSRTIAWSWDRIADWVDQCMKEGKNKI